MRLWIIILGVIVLCATSSRAAEEAKPKIPMGSVAYLDARYGFRDVRFGTPFDKLGFDFLMECWREDFDLRICHHSSDKEDKTLGVAQLLSIDHVFFKDTFIAVDLWIDGVGSADMEKNGQAALAVLKEAYGQGQVDAQGRILWRGKRASAPYAHEYPHTPIFEDGRSDSSIRITIWSNELAAQFKANQRATTKLRKQREQKETKKAAKEL